MSQLEKKLKSLIDQVELFELTKDGVVALIKNLMERYQISPADICSEKEESVSSKPAAEAPVQMTGIFLDMEVIYEGNLRSRQIVKGREPVGVVIPSLNIVLYYKERYFNDRTEALKSLFRLPRGYEWYLMTEREAISIRNIVKAVNETLQAIGGMTLGREEYMLGDDCLTKGHVRYTALLV